MLQMGHREKKDEFIEFAKKFYKYSGINLELYKRNQMERRLLNLRDKHGYDNFNSYFDALIKDTSLLSDFLNKMTINVTEFFRNHERWEALIPIVKDLANQTSTLKVWSSACSSGEEPYTLSMILDENINKRYEMLATDIDKNVLSMAQKGAYKEVQFKSMPNFYKQKYFTKSKDMWVINDKIKKPITFKTFNLLEDKYATGYDLIVCRNVMIYFTEEAKNEMFFSFSKSLKPGGVLFVGTTEQIREAKKYGFEMISSFIYRKL